MSFEGENGRNFDYYVRKIVQYLDELLDGGRLGKFDFGDRSDSQKILESVGNAVRSTGDGWIADCQTDRGQIGDAGEEFNAEILGLDVQDFRGKNSAGIVNLLDQQTVRERRDVEHVQERRFGSSDLVTRFQDVHIVLKNKNHLKNHD